LNEHDVVTYLKTKGVIIKSATQSQFVLDCPVCGREDKVYMGKTNGLWDCKAGSCGVSGNLYTYAKIAPRSQHVLVSDATVKRYQELLPGSVSAMEYLYGRGYTLETIQKFKIGVNENGFISLPLYDVNRRIYAIKYRNIDFDNQLGKYETCKSQGIDGTAPKKWMSLGGAPGLFNLENIDRTKPLLICEGEWDAIIATQIGIKNVVATPGCSNRKWIDDIKDIKEIYICYDTDEAGMKAAGETASRLGLQRCYKVLLPKQFKDLNEAVLKGFTAQQFKECVQAAEKFPVSGIVSTESFIDDLVLRHENPNKMRGIPTGHKKFDIITGGFSTPELRVITGLIGVGKTTWALDELKRYADQEYPVLIFSLETPVTKVISDFLVNFNGGTTANLSASEYRQLAREFSRIPFHWFGAKDFEGNFNIQTVMDMIRQSRDRYGIKFVLIDDLDFLMTSFSKGQNENEAVGYLMTELKMLATKLDLNISVIAHINKQVGAGLPRMRDIKGSQAIPARPDSILIIDRETSPDADPELKKDVTVIVEKNRLGELTGIVHFKFDPERRTYREV